MAVAVSDDASGVIRLAISVPNRPTPPTDATFGIWFDSDRSPSTGEPGTGAENLLIVFVGMGATVLWEEREWPEFGARYAAFRDPWGAEICLWRDKGTYKAGSAS